MGVFRVLCCLFDQPRFAATYGMLDLEIDLTGLK